MFQTLKNNTLFFILIIPCIAQSAERFEFYTGVRQMAMGGAAIGVVNDETSLLLNPAGLGRLRNSFFTLVDPEIDSAENNARVWEGKILDALEIEKLKELLMDKPGQYYSFKYQMFPSFVFPNFGIGFINKYSYAAQVNSTGDTYLLNYNNDYGPIIGYNFRIWDGRIKFGFNIKAINRTEIHEELPTSNTESYTVSNLGKRGFGIGSDVGLILTAPWILLPSLTIVTRDVGNTSYKLTGFGATTDEKPDVVEQSTHVALTISPILGKSTRSTFTFEYTDILSKDTEEDLTKRYHLGTEFNLSDILFLRAGINQRYWTAGIEFATNFFQFQLATYGEEIGTKSSPKEDRRYVTKFVFRF